MKRTGWPAEYSPPRVTDSHVPSWENIALSSNGRTDGSEPSNVGSNPTGATLYHKVRGLHMGDILAKYGLVVYDAPAAHIPVEDLKLALGPDRFAQLEKFMNGRTIPLRDGYYPWDVEQFLKGRGNLFL